MGDVYEQFKRDLERLERACAGRPREEMVRLFLLSLEREELVSVGYRETLIAHRLQRMPIPDEVKELVRHALIWTWKDEEMHAVYIRGAILRLGDRILKVQAYLQQLAGALGGWAASIRQHVRWGEAPIARGVATALTLAGYVTGKVPPEVRDHLRYRPFRDFCLFNVDAELTAAHCWRRIVDLVSRDATFSPELVADFRRIVEDEDRHRRVFQALADALGEDDRLRPGETPAALSARLAEVGEAFLPRAGRGALASENPLGSGGRVFVTGGATKEAALRTLLDDLGLEARLRRRARSLGKPLEALAVAIKPTFMMGYSRRDLSPVSDPAVVATLAAELRRIGVADVAVVEARNLYDLFFGRRAVRDVAAYFGFASPDYRVVDLSDEPVEHAYARGMAQTTVGRTWRDADFRITLGKMRSHPVDLCYLTLGNLENVGARCDAFIFPERQAGRETGVLTLAGDFPPHLAVLEAYDGLPDGLLGVMGCRRPRVARRFYGGSDALAVDLVAARHMGLREPRDSSFLRLACHWFGDPGGRTDVAGIDEPVAGWRSPHGDDVSALLSFFALPVYSFGSGRGALFVPEMDERAFPPLAPPSRALKTGRRLVQTFLGLRLGRG